MKSMSKTELLTLLEKNIAEAQGRSLKDAEDLYRKFKILVETDAADTTKKPVTPSASDLSFFYTLE